MTLATLIVFEVFALVLFWSCFGRLAHTCKCNTKRPVRWVFTALCIMGVLCAVAPWLTDYQPDALTTALLTAAALAQVVTSHYWRQGVPAQFTNATKARHTCRAPREGTKP